MGASSREKSSAAGAKKSKSSLQSLPGKLQKREKTQGSIDQPARIAALERSLAASSDLNPLVDLLSLLEPPETPKTIHAAAFALHRTFGTLARQGKLATGDADSTAASKTVKDWLRARLGDFGDSLSRLLQHSEPSIRVRAPALSAPHARRLSPSCISTDYGTGYAYPTDTSRH